MVEVGNQLVDHRIRIIISDLESMRVFIETTAGNSKSRQKKLLGIDSDVPVTIQFVVI